jgi:hypothetical protein
MPVIESTIMMPSRPRIASDQMPPGERQDDQERERPAQKRKRHRRDVAGGHPSYDGVAGPAQRRDAEQQIRLVGEPVPGSGGGSLFGSRHFKDKAPIHGAAARPADVAGPECSPAPATDTDLRRSSMAQDASRPCSLPLFVPCLLFGVASGRANMQSTDD